jgi:hypothetical protein
VDDNLAWEQRVGKVRHESAAAFFNRADEAFNLADVFTRRGSVDLHHIAGVFDLVEFLIHHDDAYDKAGASVKPDYFG